MKTSERVAEDVREALKQARREHRTAYTVDLSCEEKESFLELPRRSYDYRWTCEIIEHNPGVHTLYFTYFDLDWE